MAKLTLSEGEECSITFDDNERIAHELSESSHVIKRPKSYLFIVTSAFQKDQNRMPTGEEVYQILAILSERDQTRSIALKTMNFGAMSKIGARLQSQKCYGIDQNAQFAAQIHNLLPLKTLVRLSHPPRHSDAIDSTQPSVIGTDNNIDPAVQAILNTNTAVDGMTVEMAQGILAMRLRQNSITPGVQSAEISAEQNGARNRVEVALAYTDDQTSKAVVCDVLPESDFVSANTENISGIAIDSESATPIETQVPKRENMVVDEVIETKDKISRLLSRDFMDDIRHLTQAAALIKRIIAVHRQQFGEPIAGDVLEVIKNLSQRDNVIHAVLLAEQMENLPKKVQKIIAGKTEKRDRTKNPKKEQVFADDFDDDEVVDIDFLSDSQEGNSEFEDIDFETLGIDPGMPTAAMPGTEAKVIMLAARYAAGVPLWNEKDAQDYDSGQGRQGNMLDYGHRKD